MSSRREGNRVEVMAEKLLESEGYLVERARPDLRWIGPGRCRSMAHDIFGAFDFLAVRRDRAAPPRWREQIRLIQVTKSKSAASRRKKVAALEPLIPDIISLEVWRWRGGRPKNSDRKPRGWTKEYLDRQDGTWKGLE